ncbi:MAG: aminoacetone oxidase family FAD-binding enzyme [Anaerovoracaceae bacterium]
MVIYDVIIIGGGAAGLFCSATFSHKVKGLILEKTKSPGTKLLMSGSGQCNVTHSGSIKDFVNCYGNNGKKIRSCLYKNSNSALVNFLEENGVPTFQREDGKIFPKSLSALDVLNMLLNKSYKCGFELETNQEVLAIKKADDIFEISTVTGIFYGKKVVVACGGSSYPTTGSDGSLLSILERDLGIKTVSSKPALVPIFVQDYPFEDISGISFSDIQLSILRKDKLIAKGVGDVLLTHKSFSGPLILNFSRYVTTGDQIMLNYVYPLTYEQTMDILKFQAKNNKKDLSNILSTEFNLPKRFCKILAEQADDHIKVLANLLCRQKFSISGVSGYNVAMSTSGGVSLDEIDLQTMESKGIPGLFIIGEVLDIDGDTGGYNLQFAFSSAKATNNTL